MDFNDFKGVRVDKESGGRLYTHADGLTVTYLKTVKGVKLFTRAISFYSTPESPVSYVTQGLNPLHKDAYHLCTIEHSHTLLDEIEAYLHTIKFDTDEDADKDKKTPKLYKLKEEVLKPVITDTPMHFTQLNFLIENIGLPPEELNTILASSIAHAKETKTPVLLSYAGNYDLLVTESRIHVIQMFKTFEHPQIEEQ